MFKYYVLLTLPLLSRRNARECNFIVEINERKRKYTLFICLLDLTSNYPIDYPNLVVVVLGTLSNEPQVRLGKKINLFKGFYF